MIETDEPLPRSVYLRRRVIAVGAAVVAVLLLTWIITGFLGDDGLGPLGLATAPSSAPPTAAATASASVSASATASASAAPVSPPAAAPPAAAPAPPAPPPPDPNLPCPDATIAVAAEMDPPAFRPGNRPELRVVITNTGPVPCTRDIGRAQRELLITTGPTRLWSSNDCTPSDGAEPTILAPGVRTTFEVRWAGRTSAPGCPTQRTTVQPGPYTLTARLGTLLSPPLPFTINP
ncbi:hypothetical protein [Actinokineospora terrae]|uniref:Uncharacterized protein n=1 Tax=Actinokineospora terrae TaxID=155974 RepID=A0A1H9UAK0_9PSEU|nr:hypothetical protein [Actinokineospora terrae]SES06379.1 hypothetical protein SAMN04487818_107101 [Actinokineospora terrae]